MHDSLLLDKAIMALKNVRLEKRKTWGLRREKH
jgi:hypothetical protein